MVKKKWKKEQLDLPMYGSGPYKSSGVPVNAVVSDSHPSCNSTTLDTEVVVKIENSLGGVVMDGFEGSYRAKLPDCGSCAQTAILQLLNTIIAHTKERTKCPPCSQHVPNADTSSPLTMTSDSKGVHVVSSLSTGKAIQLKEDPSTQMSEEQKLPL